MQSHLHQQHKVNIIGLYRADFQNLGIDSISSLEGERWTLNDWYVSYPWLKPHRIYEFHTEEQIKWAKNRYPDDYKKKNKESGAEVISSHEKKYSDNALSCSIGMMIADAIDRFKVINIYGVHMIGMGHEVFVSGILEIIEIARSKGIEVNCLYEKEWIEFAKTHSEPQQYYMDVINAQR